MATATSTHRTAPKAVRFAFLGMLTCLLHACAPQAADQTKLVVEKADGSRSPFTVELALNDEQRQRGLMMRKELPAGHGMLFDFGDARPIGMWMKNTYIPLDMLFIRSDGTIHRIEAMTTPHSTRVIDSGAPVRFVLEIAGGVAQVNNIRAGDKIVHPLVRR
jgi:uncharacterized protein